jgi:hypothetical protein
MGALADSVLDAGGEAIGVIPRSLLEKEIAHTGLSDLHIVESMHERARHVCPISLTDSFFCLADLEAGKNFARWLPGSSWGSIKSPALC